MKKTLSVLGFALFAILMLPGILKPPAEFSTKEKRAVKERAGVLIAELKEYREKMGSFPAGDNAAIVTALRDLKDDNGNPAFEIAADWLNDHGEVVDPWGTAFRITCNEETKTPRIQSAGPNMIFETGHKKRGLKMGDDYDSWH